MEMVGRPRSVTHSCSTEKEACLILPMLSAFSELQLKVPPPFPRLNVPRSTQEDSASCEAQQDSRVTHTDEMADAQPAATHECSNACIHTSAAQDIWQPECLPLAMTEIKELWAHDDPSKWLVAFHARRELFAERGKEGLAELDRWLEEDLPANIEARKPDRLVTAEELVKTVEWKLKRGTHRPKLLQWAREAKTAEVEAASRSAFARAAEAAQAPDQAGYQQKASEALSALTVLKARPTWQADSNDGSDEYSHLCKGAAQGVGPATASALLSAAEPCFPYMGDEAMAAAFPQSQQYTPKRYLEFAAAMRKKALALNAGSKQGEMEWTAKAVEQALHSTSLRVVAKPAKQAEQGRKRKQAD